MDLMELAGVPRPAQRPTRSQAFRHPVCRDAAEKKEGIAENLWWPTGRLWPRAKVKEARRREL